MSERTPIPAAADFVVVGGGSAGAAIAGLLAERSEGSVVLLEAGPDYGPLEDGRWPADLLDAATLAIVSHDWGYQGEVQGRAVPFHRAKVIGGCSSHNGGVAVKGSRLDYDRWAAAGNEGWSTEELLPLFDSVWRRLRVRSVPLEDLTPFQAACTRAIDADGIPIVDDLNDLDETVGVAPFPISIDLEGRRINTAFAYLDPVRDRPNLAVVGGATVERVLLDGASAAGVAVRRDGEERVVRSPCVILAAGAYGSPAVLLRSGIGPPSHLDEVGVAVSHQLPGVGENLHDQPTVEIDYEGSEELRSLMTEFGRERWRADEQVIAKYPSSHCEEGFDLHIWPVGGRNPLIEGAWRWTLGAALLTPASRGYLRLTGPSSDDPPLIDHRFLSDPEGSDLSRLVEVVDRSREIGAAPELSALLGEELFPGPEVRGIEALTRCVAGSSLHYWHPVGSCKMGPDSDAMAVVGADGRVHGLDGLYVADASIMPSMISGNTNVPTIVIGEKLARGLTST
jgi:choline dehydrogenase